ncbi:transglycosylase SLT domain-containing protein [Bdellovibrio sp. HCB2-146]|uniref:transglycosylase SLT domain-containing protein n=1 Tax=Bdellovibrio sp. HCB2-146 TaxID=3394362 RepID=UPI0039BC9731
MRRLLISFSFFSTVMGCTTTSHKDTRFDSRLTPPLASFQAKWKNASVAELQTLTPGSREENIFWWKSYLLGQALKEKSPAEACAQFKPLALATEFPLNDLALLRAYEVCPASEKLPALPPTVAPWYKELFVNIKLKEAIENKDDAAKLEALIDKAQLNDNKKEKEELYLQALALAEKSAKPEDITRVKTALYKNSPRLNPEPTPKDWSAIAMDYRYHREFDKALETYKKILAEKNVTPEESFNALKNIRQTNKVAQRRTDYINSTADLVNKAKADFQKNKKDRKAIARYHDAQILFARTLWTEDQTSRAVQVLNETHRLLRGLYPMDEVYFILGRIDEEKGNFAKALEYFEASYTQPISQAGLKDKVTWLKSWNYYKLEKWPEAKQSFEQMRELNKEPSDKARARFWLARSYDKLGDKTSRDTELKALIQEDPLGYYGMLATREMGTTFPAIQTHPTEALNLDLFQVSGMAQQNRLMLEWLISVNEKGFAEKALNAAVEDLKKQNISDETTWLAISSAYARSGLYLPLFSAIGGLKPEVKDRLLNDHPDLLFPQPYADIIKAASEKSGTPQEFIFSIIRQESAFNPEARSSADAFGLMQLLPSIAKELARRYNLEYKEALDLNRPEINIPLGAYELKSLMDKYDQQFILSVSGYNANDSAIRGWMKTRFRPDPVEFIEEVPYEETRTYIKLVMRNYVFYRRLLNPQTPITFPEDLLKLKK